MNIYLWIIVAALLLEFFLHTLSRLLDLKNLSTVLPEEFVDYYSPEKYAKSQQYLKENTRFAYVISTFNFIIILLVIFLGLFNTLDVWIRGFGFSPLIEGLIFFGVLFFIQDVISTPFSLYGTFVIEEKFDFNKTSPRTFILDKIKGYFLIIILGSVVLSCLIYFFETYGDLAWLYAWISISGFLILIQPLFTLVIAPMFNKFTPLEDGALRERITDYAKMIDFPIGRIDVMDGSRRSSKSNAYFSGFGKNKRIALFDTLIEKHSDDELLSIIAHEVGHYKCRHNIKGIVLGVVQSGLMFFMLSFFIQCISFYKLNRGALKYLSSTTRPMKLSGHSECHL